MSPQPSGAVEEPRQVLASRGRLQAPEVEGEQPSVDGPHTGLRSCAACHDVQQAHLDDRLEDREADVAPAPRVGSELQEVLRDIQERQGSESEHAFGRVSAVVLPGSALVDQRLEPQQTRLDRLPHHQGGGILHLDC